MNLDSIKAIFFTGNNYFEQGHFKLAEKKYLEVLDHIPDHKSSLFNLLTIYLDNNLEFDKIRNLKKYKFEDYYFSKIIINSINLSTISDSIKFIEINIRNIKLNYEDNDHLLILYYLNLLYQNNNNFYKAFLLIKRFSKLKKNLSAINFVALYYLLIGNFNKAHFFNKLLYSLNSTDKTIKKNLGYSYLYFKNFKKGFELVENRNIYVDDDKFNLIEKLVDYKKVKNKNILIFAEAGLGDNLHFFKFVLFLVKKIDYSNNIFFYCNRKLQNLFSNINFDHKDRIKFICSEDKFEYNFDYQTSILSIPKVLNLSSTEILKFKDFKLIKKNNIPILKKNMKKNVGICYSGNKSYKNDRFRSIEFNTFKKLLNYNGNYHYFVLQQINDSASLQFDLKNFSYLGNEEFEVLPYILKQMDFVITTDTSIAHLCGILNVTTYLLLSKNAEWRWFDDNHISSWYPSVQILKQKKLNDWSSCSDYLKDKVLI